MFLKFSEISFFQTDTIERGVNAVGMIIPPPATTKSGDRERSSRLQLYKARLLYGGGLISRDITDLLVQYKTTLYHNLILFSSLKYYQVVSISTQDDWIKIQIQDAEKFDTFTFSPSDFNGFITNQPLLRNNKIQVVYQ